MNGVMGMLELALGFGPAAEPHRHYVAMARASAESLLGIINDILDFRESRKRQAGAGADGIRPQGTAPGNTVKMLAARAQKKGLELIPPRSPRGSRGSCRRPPALESGDHQPGRQRDQVHRAR